MKFTSTATVVATFATTAILATTGTANAQDATVQGPGYALNESTVAHPSVGAETGYISNVFYEEDTPAGAGVLRILGKISITPSNAGERTGTPPEFTYSAGARFEYEEFISSNASVKDQRNLGLGVDVALGIKPASTFPVTIDNNFVRTNRPTNFESNTVLSRDINTFKAGVKYVPQGRNISGRLRYTNTLDYFESDGSAFANRMLNNFQLGVDWQFLPITRFYAQASYGINGGLGADSTKVSSNPIRGSLGVASAITESITLRAHGGYAHGSYAERASFSGFVYGLEAGYRYSPIGRVRLIFDRDFKDSINSNFYGDYMAKVALDQQIQRVMLQASVEGHLRSYGGVDASFGGGDTRDDVILAAGVRANYEMREWLGLNASYTMRSVQTEFVSMIGGEIDNPDFARHQVTAGATAAF